MISGVLSIPKPSMRSGRSADLGCFKIRSALADLAV
jgi:hypothetical protein